MNSDFRDLFAALNAAGARYLVVGGYALALHAEPRFTKDLDVWIDRTAENAQAVWNALAAFGAPVTGVSADDLASPDLVYQLGVAPSRIDILTSIDGVEFVNAWPRRVEERYGDQQAFFIGLADLVENKRAAGRPQDMADLELLQRHLNDPLGRVSD
jgi:hypothetical protein